MSKKYFCQNSAAMRKICEQTRKIAEKCGKFARDRTQAEENLRFLLFHVKLSCFHGKNRLSRIHSRLQSLVAFFCKATLLFKTFSMFHVKHSSNTG